MKATALNTVNRFFNSAFVLSLREAFISLIPFLVVSALAALFLSVIRIFTLLDEGNWLVSLLTQASSIFTILFPLLTVTTFSYYLAKNHSLNSVSASVLSIATFFTTSSYIRIGEEGIAFDASGATIYAILVPCLAIFILKKLTTNNLLGITDSQFISVFLRGHLNLIIPFFLSFYLLYLLVPLITEVSSYLFGLLSSDTPISTEWAIVQRLLFGHLFWLLGIHGANAFDSIKDNSFLADEILPGISAHTFADTFVTIGGAGCIWGFFFAAILFSKDNHLKQVTKFSLPFTMFNFAEILIYSVPIVLNPYFIIPFILCPLVNFVVSYYVVGSGIIPYSQVEVPWVTPAIISGFLIGNGSLVTMLYQVALIALNTLIYMPFVKMYTSSTNEQKLFNQLARNLSISKDIEYQSEKKFLNEQQQKQDETKQLKQILDELNAGELQVYYQPKIDPKLGQVVGFEALLRLKDENGKVKGPYFLPILEETGFTRPIDLWVINQVASDLKTWSEQGFEPKVSINLNPDNLIDKQIVERLLASLKPFAGQIEIEILECAYIKNFSIIRENIALLKKQGIKTAIDDFGTGFSSLSLLSKLNADTIKLDKSVLDATNTEKGAVLYQQICALCNKLGFRLVAEGVETNEQQDFAIEAGIDHIQGWLYSPAIPFEQVEDYQKSFTSTSTKQGE